MKKRMILAVGLISALFILGSTTAEEKAGSNQKNEEPSQAEYSLRNIAYGIDLWHDSNLKGDENKVKQFKSNLLELIKLNINNCRFEYAQNERKELSSKHDEQGKSIRSKELEKEYNYIKVKEKLYLALKKTEAFSNQYRLFNDYVDLLKQELGVTKVELAEEIQHISGDKKN